MNTSKLDAVLLVLLRLGAFLGFAGWTWVHFYWEGPYGVLLWHEDTYALAERFGITWDEFVGTGGGDGIVQKWVSQVAWLYLACTILTLTVRKKSWLQMSVLLCGSGLLTILSYAKYVSAYREFPMFIEHGGQMLMPVLLVLAIRLGPRHRAAVATALLALIMTFAGHGSYALGLWPTPGSYYAMVSLILGVEHETANLMLRTCGFLDFVVCIGVCLPFVRQASAGYAAIWGLATAIARPAAGMSTSLLYWGADQFVHEAVLRAPHFIIPAYLFVLFSGAKAGEAGNSLRTADATVDAAQLPTLSRSRPSDR